jgi:hypothetical protein
MAQVTYLLGAGASADCVPIVSEMANDIAQTISKLYKLFNLKDRQTSWKVDPSFQFIVKTEAVLDKLRLACETHYSIDTYAKKLYLIDKPAFQKLKFDLSFYLTLIQILNPIDKRYDNFWASLLDDTSNLPRKVKVISWNYDFQIEKSFQNLTNLSNLNTTSSFLRHCCPTSQFPNNMIQDEFCYIKLNGSAKIRIEDERSNFLTEYNGKQRTLIKDLADKYFLIKSEACFSELQFAWEGNNKLMEHIKPLLSTIQVLVIIGYSFPFFNRSIDSELFKSMHNLRTIYIQDKNPDIVKETLDEIIDLKVFRYDPDNEYLSREINVICKDKVNQFVFPKELEI